MIRWDAPGPYVVGFTTREGGVSEGPFESLNLGSKGDDPARVAENRRRACEALGLDAARLARQPAAAFADREPRPAGARDEPGDGLWTDEPGLPMLALSADCVPIAIAATGGRPALAVVHAGWRGLAEGVVGAACARTRRRRDRRDHRPGGRAVLLRGRPGGLGAVRRRPDTHDGILDLWAASERALRRAGVGRVERLDLCTRCTPELFFSHRRSGDRRGAQGVIGALAG